MFSGGAPLADVGGFFGEFEVALPVAAGLFSTPYLFQRHRKIEVGIRESGHLMDGSAVFGDR